MSKFILLIKKKTCFFRQLKQTTNFAHKYMKNQLIIVSLIMQNSIMINYRSVHQELMN